jgi:hypothetical protein
MRFHTRSAHWSCLSRTALDLCLCVSWKTRSQPLPCPPLVQPPVAALVLLWNPPTTVTSFVSLHIGSLSTLPPTTTTTTRTISTFKLILSSILPLQNTRFCPPESLPRTPQDAPRNSQPRDLARTPSDALESGGNHPEGDSLTHVRNHPHAASQQPRRNNPHSRT